MQYCVQFSHALYQSFDVIRISNSSCMNLLYVIKATSRLFAIIVSYTQDLMKLLQSRAIECCTESVIWIHGSNVPIQYFRDSGLWLSINGAFSLNLSRDLALIHRELYLCEITSARFMSCKY